MPKFVILMLFPFVQVDEDIDEETRELDEQYDKMDEQLFYKVRPLL